MLFDSTNPAAWDIAGHERHAAAGVLLTSCAYCVRTSAVVSAPSADLLEVAARAFTAARAVDLGWLEERCSTEEERQWVRQWPGEHYRLLSAFARTTKPSLIVEVGTYTGMGTLALADGAGAAPVITYDVVAWDGFPNTLLRAEDFDGSRIEQRLGDLSDDDYFAQQRETLLAADLVFVDGPKDGRFESIFYPHLLALLDGHRHVVLADDIHFLNMIQLWMELPVEKLDISSFGHWSGTGLMRTS